MGTPKVVLKVKKVGELVVAVAASLLLILAFFVFVGASLIADVPPGAIDAENAYYRAGLRALGATGLLCLALMMFWAINRWRGWLLLAGAALLLGLGRAVAWILR